MARFAEPLTGPLTGPGLGLQMPVFGGARSGTRLPIGSGVTIIVGRPKPAMDDGCRLLALHNRCGTCGITGRGGAETAQCMHVGGTPRQVNENLSFRRERRKPVRCERCRQLGSQARHWQKQSSARCSLWTVSVALAGKSGKQRKPWTSCSNLRDFIGTVRGPTTSHNVTVPFKVAFIASSLPCLLPTLIPASRGQAALQSEAPSTTVSAAASAACSCLCSCQLPR